MIRSNKKSRNGASRVSRAGDKIALLRPAFFEFDERQTVLRQNCHLYANFGGEIKRKRGWGQEHGRGLGQKRQRGWESETRIYPIREYTCCCTSGRHFWRRVFFWGGLRGASEPPGHGKRLLLLETRRVATIPLCISFGRPLWDTSTHTLCPGAARG